MEPTIRASIGGAFPGNRPRCHRTLHDQHTLSDAAPEDVEGDKPAAAPSSSTSRKAPFGISLSRHVDHTLPTTVAVIIECSFSTGTPSRRQRVATEGRQHGVRTEDNLARARTAPASRTAASVTAPFSIRCTGRNEPGAATGAKQNEASAQVLPASWGSATDATAGSRMRPDRASRCAASPSRPLLRSPTPSPVPGGLACQSGAPPVPCGPAPCGPAPCGPAPCRPAWCASPAADRSAPRARAPSGLRTLRSLIADTRELTRRRRLPGERRPRGPRGTRGRLRRSCDSRRP